MKWTENGITFEGTVAEYRELHSETFRQLRRTRIGRRVTVLSDGEPIHFSTIKNAAEWIAQQTGKYVSASALGKMLDGSGTVSLDRFATASLFAPIDNNTQGGNPSPETQTQQEENQHE